ncbi:MAG: amidohydrolase [Candidatus Rokubacteria bacterium]|nr:amidohydrolase [Candidatus Rokubacteria bacterium]
MDPSLPRAQALAVKDGRIVEVGGDDEILWLREDGYELHDLGGRTVLPGFIDPHNHFSIAALDCFFVDCRDAHDISDIQGRMREAAAGVPASEWVRGFCYDHRALAERRHPTRHDLDAAVSDRPALLVHYSHHQAVANSRALAAAGITRQTPDPPGGEIARDRGGEPTGLLFERAMGIPEARSREGWESRFVEVARAASLRYARHGITAVQDAAVTPAMARRYAEARATGALAIHVGEMMVSPRGWFEAPDAAAPGETLKLFVDGGYRCALRYPRGGAMVTSGFLFYERAALAGRLVDAWRAGRRVTCHAIGNLGVETAVGAIEDALRAEPAGRARVRIDHAIFLTRALIARLADLGVWVVAQPSFLYDRGRHEVPGEILVRPFRSVAEAGIPQAFSSDFPCGSLDPLVGVYAAVTRRTRTGEVADGDQALSVQAALEAYTIDAARAAGLAGERGSLEPGKRADFLVLSGDPLECSDAALLDLRVVETWVGGERVTNAP